MDLQETFYLLGIIYMSIMFVLMIAIVIAVFVIKHKIHMIQRSIEDKLHSVLSAVHVGEALIEKAKEAFGKHKK